MVRRVNYFLSETVANLGRNLFMTAAAVSIVTVSLLLLGSVIVFGDIMGRIVGLFDERIEVNVFLLDEVTPDQNRELESSLTSMPEVRSVQYVSKSQAFEEYKEMFADSPAMVENIDSSVLPASYRVKLRDPSKVEIVRSRIDGRPGVEEVIFGGDFVKRLLKLNAVLRVVVLAVTFLFLGAATLLIGNTIRLAIYARRREIGIMKLVGATNWFIRVPFIFEGMVEAAMGALVATGFVYVFKLLFLDNFQELVPFLPVTVGFGEILQVFLTVLAVGVFIGALGSALALRRFLEV